MKILQSVWSLAGSTLLCISTSVSAETQSYIDLQAGLGYSSNPLLVVGDRTGSAFGRVSAFGYYGRTSERSATSISGYVENSSYLRRFSNKQAFSLDAKTSRSISKLVRLFGDVTFSGDSGAQLSSRFYGVPAGSIALDPTAPGSLLAVSPDLYGLNRQQYRLSGQVGASVTLSPRDSLTAAIGAQHLFSSGSNDNLSYTQYDGSVAYERQINERLSVGGRIIGQSAHFPGRGTISSAGPQATVHARLSDDWDATGALGFVNTREDLGALGGTHSSIDLAFDGSLCHNVKDQRFCGRVSRRTQSSLIGAAPTSTSAGLDYYRRLSARDTIQATADILRSSFRLGEGNQRSTFYSLAGSYDRKVNDRLSIGANAAARKLTRASLSPKADVGGSVFVRYRLGDVR